MKQKQDNHYTPQKSEILGNDKSFRLALFACSTGGKSYMISEFLTNPEWGLIPNKFDSDRVYLICPTISFDDSYSKVIDHLEKHSVKDHEFDKEKQVFEKELETSLANVYKHLFEEQRGKKQSGLKQDHSLIVLDDFFLEIDASSPFSPLLRMLTKMRHANISIILACQVFRGLNSGARLQLSHCMFFPMTSQKELKKVQEELAGSIKGQQFDAIFNYCTGQQPHSYMLCIKEFPESHRFFKGHGKELEQLQI